MVWWGCFRHHYQVNDVVLACMLNGAVVIDVCVRSNVWKPGLKMGTDFVCYLWGCPKLLWFGERLAIRHKTWSHHIYVYSLFMSIIGLGDMGLRIIA